MTFVVAVRVRLHSAVHDGAYRAIIHAAESVGAYASFVPSGQTDDLRVQLVEVFGPLQPERDVVFSISSSPYDHASSELYDSIMLDEQGFSDESKTPVLAKLIETFLSNVNIEGEYLLILSDGFAMRQDFLSPDRSGRSISESLAATFEANSLPPIVLTGALPLHVSL